MLQEVRAERSTRQTPPTDRLRAWMPAVILLLLDGLYVLGNVVHMTSNAPDEPITPFSAAQWDGDNDGSYIEMFGHTQLLAGALMLMFLTVIRRSPSFAVWAVVLLTLVADDFLRLHENGGAILVDSLALPAVAGLRAQDLGELVVWGAMGGLLGCALLVTYILGSATERRDTGALSGWLLLLVVFAIGVDLVHFVVDPYLGYSTGLALTLVETTGELVAMTLIVLAIHRITMRPTHSPS